MQNLSQLYSLVARYVDGDLQMADMEDWIIPRLPPLLALPPEDPLRDLAGAIELGRDELQDGIITEEELKESLSSLLRARPILVPKGEGSTNLIESLSSASTNTAPAGVKFVVLTSDQLSTASR